MGQTTARLLHHVGCGLPQPLQPPATRLRQLRARAHACCFTAHTFPVQCAVLRSHLCWVVQPSPVLQAEHTQADKLSTHAEPKTTRRTHFLHDLLLTSARQAQA